LNEKLKTAIHEKQSTQHSLSVDAVSSDLPPGVDVKLFLKHGFYQHKNKLYFKTVKGIRQGANFTLHPLFHVKSLTEAKRLFRIKNEYGATEIIELMQKDLTSLQAFKLRVESLGNFLWVLGEAELARLKGWLYANTETCQEIKQLGYQKEGCFRDIIVKRFGFFPLLNFFGPKVTGKTELAACMLHFFGNAHPGPNINNTTKPALADHVARFSNALCHIDEYKNNLEYEKIEFLKGVWVVLLASFRTLKDKLQIPYDYENFLQLTSDLVLRQDSDFRVISTTELKTDKRQYSWEEPFDVLLLNHTRVFDKYRKHGAQTRDNVLPKKSMEYYLMHSKEYLGRRRSCRFSMRNHINGDTDFETKPKAQVTTAMAFSYDKLKKKYGLSVTLTSDYEDDFMEKEDTDTLPY
jgi:hypothetical protein